MDGTGPSMRSALISSAPFSLRDAGSNLFAPPPRIGHITATQFLTVPVPNNKAIAERCVLPRTLTEFRVLVWDHLCALWGGASHTHKGTITPGEKKTD